MEKYSYIFVNFLEMVFHSQRIQTDLAILLAAYPKKVNNSFQS
jgi:hypothetical protein